ncbi:MAG: glycosyltransferase [Actinobacteria bacterium]|nr:glycosyltransferase [Actinomycetota bacterium]
MRAINESEFVIASNGFADGPAQALRDHLISFDAPKVVTIFHPLVREGDTRHRITTYRRGQDPSVRLVGLPCRPPLTYPLDLFVPPRVKPVDFWFGFNNLAALRGLLGRRKGTSKKVVYSCVDFVPDRFGKSAATKLYDRLDRYVCRKADARFELSDAALKGRNERHQLSSAEMAPAHVVPMGAWLDRVPVTSPEAHAARRIVYLGHLVERQGVKSLIRAVSILRNQNQAVEAHIIGQGPMESELQALSAELGLTELVQFHGFVEDHLEVERLLASCSLGLAPYQTGRGSFTQYADPGKLKAYLAAGLPIITTEVPPNASELASSAGAEIVDDSPESLASGIARLLDDPGGWLQRREAALSYMKRFDWGKILGNALPKVGLTE